jgi:hypothetical protein
VAGVELPFELSVVERIRPSAPLPRPTTPDSGFDATLPGDWFLWRVTAEILATKVFRRLSSGTLQAAMDGPLRGVLDRCETAAGKVGDTQRRMAISPTVETARNTLVNIARQLIESGCTEEQSRDMIAVAERERERIRGRGVDSEMEYATVEPIIVEG